MVLQIEVDAAAIPDFLVCAGQLDRLHADDRRQIERALEKLLATLTRIDCDAQQRDAAPRCIRPFLWRRSQTR
jgi:hypothetical protein